MWFAQDRIAPPYGPNVRPSQDASGTPAAPLGHAAPRLA